MFRGMATIAMPTWSECQRMSQLELDALNVVKGEANGDKFLWDTEYYDAEHDITVTGVWRSTVEDKKDGGR